MPLSGGGVKSSATASEPASQNLVPQGNMFLSVSMSTTLPPGIILESPVGAPAPRLVIVPPVIDLLNIVMTPPT